MIYDLGYDLEPMVGNELEWFHNLDKNHCNVVLLPPHQCSDQERVNSSDIADVMVTTTTAGCLNIFGQLSSDRDCWNYTANTTLIMGTGDKGVIFAVTF